MTRAGEAYVSKRRWALNNEARAQGKFILYNDTQLNMILRTAGASAENAVHRLYFFASLADTMRFFITQQFIDLDLFQFTIVSELYRIYKDMFSI